MAIQLNDRDQQIFKLIEEHHVLLEKHIAWFISKDGKPVLIRDRLRKLFYLDYLLCSRHTDILPWWTTPTKPLVYTLSGLARHSMGADDVEYDLSENKVQQHFLELANLRMLLLMSQKDGLTSSVQWMTLSNNMTNLQTGSSNSVNVQPQVVEATVSFRVGTEQKLIGIINSPFADSYSLILQLEEALNGLSVNQLWIICQDNIHRALLQEMVAAAKPFGDKVLFATHGDLYSLGIVRSKWQTADRKEVAIIDQAGIDAAAKASSDNIWPLPLGSFPHVATA